MATFTFTMYSHAMHRHTDVTAIIPAEKPAFPGVPFDPDKPFKSIYLLHGYSGSHADWLRGSKIQQLAQQFRIAVFCPEILLAERTVRAKRVREAQRKPTQIGAQRSGSDLNHR